MIVLGLVLIGISFKEAWILIYGIPVFVIGVIILFNSKEDKIEEIKKAKGGKKWVIKFL